MLEHLLELTAALADRDHMRDDRWKASGGLERLGEAFAFSNALACDIDDLHELHVAEDVARDLHRLEDGDAAAQQGRQGAREAGDRDHEQEVAEERDAQHEAVPLL